MVEHVGTELDGMGDMAKTVTIGTLDVLPLPKGEPGGRVVGRGKDLRGVFRLVRVKHNLSDWWTDPTALNALAKWLNERTKVKTDLNVEGGAVRLTDAHVLKSPMLWMTGDDLALARSMNLVREGGVRRENQLTQLEAVNLRRYLVEKKGLLILDDCGLAHQPTHSMMRIFKNQLRLVMPEYGAAAINRDHRIYHCFYELGGPPAGFESYLWGAVPTTKNYLEGVSIGDKLVAVMIERDYMCGMEAVSVPTRSVRYSPRIYRWATNAVVYALTTGGIAD